MQTAIYSIIDNGFSPFSWHHLRVCCQFRSPWTAPLELIPTELQRAWNSGHDLVVEHFFRQGVRGGHAHVAGWKFSEHDQVIGVPFSWGLQPQHSWSKQISRLLVSTGMSKALLYTVIPECRENPGEVPLQLLVPYERHHLAPLLLVVEHVMLPPKIRRAVHCAEPCSVRSVFDIVGLGYWCDDKHVCTITFAHGRCRKDFQGDDKVEVPTASLVRLSVQNAPESQCASAERRSVDSLVRMSSQIASQVSQAGDKSSQQVAKRIQEVILHADQVEDHSLMQRGNPGSPVVARGEHSDSVPTTLTPRTLDVSTEQQPANVEDDHTDVFDRVLTWTLARRFVTEYERSSIQRTFPRDILVHLICLEQYDTTNVHALCPRWILDSDRQLCRFIDWCEEFTFQHTQPEALAFPLLGEVYQNTPSLLVVDRIEQYLVPILVHLVSEDEPRFIICMSYRFMQVASILDWLHQHVVLTGPIDISFNGRRVFRADEIETQAGAILCIRLLTEIELAWPLPDTREPDSSLSMLSHGTWTSLPDGRTRWEPSSSSDSHGQRQRGDDGEEHTLMQLETRASLRDAKQGFELRLDQMSLVQESEGQVQDEMVMMQLVAFSDSSRQFSIPGVAENYAVLLQDINAIMSHVQAVFRPRLADDVHTIQVIRGDNEDLQDVLLRVVEEDFVDALAFMRVLWHLLPARSNGIWRDFLARVRLVEMAPLLILAPQRTRQHLPHLVVQAFLTKRSQKRIVQIEFPRRVADYRMDRGEDDHASAFRSDGVVVPPDYVVPILPAVVIQIDVTATRERDVGSHSTFEAPAEDEIWSCMQMPVRRDADGLLQHALQAYNVQTLRVFAWLHTWDRKEQWSFVWSGLLIDPQMSVRDQLIAHWQPYQVRPTVTIVPVQPRNAVLHNSHPVYLLLPVIREDYLGMIVTVTAPSWNFQGSYLLHAVQWPRVFQVFHQLLPANQCIWHNDCFAQIGPRVYAWHVLLPLYNGVHLQLIETARPPGSSSEETCTAGTQSSSGDDNSWDSPDEFEGSEPNASLQMFQLQAIVWRGSVVRHARERLPPPGNGAPRNKKVSFDHRVEVNKVWCDDPSIVSDRLAHVRQSMQVQRERSGSKGANRFVDSFLTSTVQRILHNKYPQRKAEHTCECWHKGAPKGLALQQAPESPLPIDAVGYADCRISNDEGQACWLWTPAGLSWVRSRDIRSLSNREEVDLVLLEQGESDVWVAWEPESSIVPVQIRVQSTYGIVFVALESAVEELEQVLTVRDTRPELHPRVKVESAFQVFSCDAFQKCETCRPGRSLILLESCLHDTTFQEVQWDCRVPAFWWNELHALWPDALGGLPEGMQLHAATALALSKQGYVIPFNELDAITVYVDGSASKLGAGWSVVVVGMAGDQEQLLGIMSGPVVEDHKHEHWIGAVRVDNIEAELTAFVVATAFALAANLNVEILVRPDLAYSCGLYDGSVAPKKDRPLTGLAVGLSRIARELGLTAVARVCAHVGHPWNELADRVAKQASHGNVVGRPRYSWLNQLAQSPVHVEWWWTQFSPLQQRSACAVASNGKSSGRLFASNAELIQPVTGKHDSLDVNFTCLTCNALSLIDEVGDQSGVIDNSRVARADWQLNNAGVLVAGFQEARTAEGVRRTANYHVYASGCSRSQRARQFGCELWIHSGMSFDEQKQVTFASSNCFCRCATPRLLIVQVENAIGVWCFVVGHAPYWQNGSNEAADWWQECARQILDCPEGAHVLCMIDANAPLATHANEYHGLVGSESPRAATRAFEMFLEQCRLYVPQTFPGVHRGQHGTWKHPKGGWTRIDYILASQGLAKAAFQSECRMSFDLGFTHEDHVPVQMAFGATLQAIVPEKNAFRIDRHRCQHPSAQQAFQKDLAALPWPVCGIDQEAHASWLLDQVKRLALRHFPAGKKHRKAVWMSEEAIQWVSWKRHVLDAFRNVREEAIRADLKEELRWLEKIVRVLCKRDRKAFFDQVVVELEKAGQAHDTRLVMSKLAMLGRPKKGANSRKLLPKVKTLEGRVPASYTEQQMIWFNLFSEVEAAHEVDPHVLEKQQFEVHSLFGVMELEDMPACRK